MNKKLYLLFLIFTFTAYSQGFDKKINELASKYQSNMIELRHWFHQNAELSNREF